MKNDIKTREAEKVTIRKYSREKSALISIRIKDENGDHTHHDIHNNDGDLELEIKSGAEE